MKYVIEHGLSAETWTHQRLMDYLEVCVSDDKDPGITVYDFDQSRLEEVEECLEWGTIPFFCKKMPVEDWVEEIREERELEQKHREEISSPYWSGRI